MTEVTRVDGFLVDHNHALGGKMLQFTRENLGHLRQYLDLLKANYDPDLLDPESVIRGELRLTKRGRYATPHVIMVAGDMSESESWERDPAGIDDVVGRWMKEMEVVAAASGNMMPIKFESDIEFFDADDGETTITNKAAFGILSYSPPEVAGTDNPTYMAVEGLGSELEQIARQRSRLYLGEVVEAEPAKVEIYRSWGFQVLEGVPYLQPVLDWKRDGRPAKQEVELPLMVRTAYDNSLGRDVRSMTDKITSVSPQDFAVEVVNALYDWTIPSSDEFSFRDGRAERNAVQYHETMRDRVLDAIVKPGNDVRLVLD